ncbi:MAG: GrpB family protein [Marmoricola sp.]
MKDVARNPATLVAHDPSWAVDASRHLADLHAALGGLGGVSKATFDHIGSTSVPGLAAKPYIDLQIGIFPLPSHDALASRLGLLGYQQEFGSRADSPGVGSDTPRGTEVVADEVWEKRLYVLPREGVILHIRRADSPWARHTVWFRDWLRANPDALARYGATKRELSKANEGKPDVDDYTRAKTAFFDEVQAEFTQWARRRQ